MSVASRKWLGRGLTGLTGAAAFLAYASTHATDPIWKGAGWDTMVKHTFDGLVYALLTAGVFGWLWP